MREGIGPAIDQVMTCAPDAVIMGVAHRSLHRRRRRRRRLAERAVRPRRRPRFDGFDGGGSRARKFGAKRIAVLTPHQPKGDETVRAYLAEAGFDIVRLVGMKCASPFAIAQVQPPEPRNVLREIDGDDIDAHPAGRH